MTNIIYEELNTKIENSYLLTEDDIKVVVCELMKERKKRCLPVNRKQISYIREIKVHNRLYKMGLFKSHTKDTDLEEIVDKRKEKIYSIIGR